VLPNSAIITPAAPAFHGTQKRKTRKQDCKPGEQERVQPIAAARHAASPKTAQLKIAVRLSVRKSRAVNKFFGVLLTCKQMFHAI
jgi:hypothetical protein